MLTTLDWQFGHTPISAIQQSLLLKIISPQKLLTAAILGSLKVCQVQKIFTIRIIALMSWQINPPRSTPDGEFSNNMQRSDSTLVGAMTTYCLSLILNLALKFQELKP
jgi:hypothetical protein